MRESRNRAPEHLSSSELVTFALEDTRSFKNVARRLKSREPNEGAAKLLVSAYEQRKSPAWLTACLLGCIGHRCGYDAVKSILELQHAGGQAENYAGEAMVRIAGGDAAKDLLEILESSPNRRSRNGAAWGLAEIKSYEFSGAEIATRVITAVSQKRLNRGSATYALEQIGVTEKQLVCMLQSKNRNEIRLARDLLRARYEGSTLRVPVSQTVFGALRRVLEAEGPQLPDIVRSDLHELLDSWSSIEAVPRSDVMPT